MPTPQKDAAIDTLKQAFGRSSSAVLLDFQGLNVETVTKLRDEFRKAGVEYKVVKNTLVWHALKDKPFLGKIERALVGMTGVAWSFEDPSAAAKVVKAFRKDHQKLTIKAGLIEGTIIDGQGVEDQLATMPGKDELRAMLLATFQAPSQQFVQLLQAPAQNLVYALKAKEEQASGGA
jgi:large subunit ribosomal protein L10